jgi:peptidoglycan hydrolase-like protein with peptidoglycan-binding domain
MPRRSLLLTLVLAMLAASVSIGVAALHARSPRVAAETAVPLPARQPPASERPAPEPEAAYSDLLLVADPVKLFSTPASDAAPEPGPDLAFVQRRLTELRYYIGAIDGEAGAAMRSAVTAFQKVNGLSADGVVGSQTLAALASPVTPTLRGGSVNRVEIDLDKQVLYYVEGGRLARIMPVSSGNGASYRTRDGSLARSLTPVGTFQVERRISGLREADLGTLYDPMYFHKGWAIHGSNSVPSYPASHGCIRVTRADALWLFDRLPVGTTVRIYGGTHTSTPGHNTAGTDTPAGDTPSSAPAPAHPARPAQPAAPAHPARPAQPATSAHPAKPAQPTRPAQPAVPASQPPATSAPSQPSSSPRSSEPEPPSAEGGSGELGTASR